MSVSPDEVRLAGLAMAAAYALLAGGAFIPSYRRRKVEAAPVRGTREVSAVVDRLWVGTQGALLLGLLVALVAPQGFSVSPISLLSTTNLAATMVGTALFLAGCALISWAAIHLGAELTVAIETREGGRLVTSGPYARVRHPLYTGVFFMIGGAALALASPALAAYTLIAMRCANVRARAEEDLLSSDPVHGEVYGAYRSRTGRFLPKVPGIREA